jgi:hypothetical protein
MDGGAMMKPGKITCRTLLLIAVIAAALITLVAVSTCTNPVGEALNSPSFGLVGTWISSTAMASYNPGACSRLTVNVDGTFRSQDTGGGIVYTGTYTIDSVSVSGNSRTFRVHYVYSAGPAHDWVLARVTGGTLYESVYMGGAGPYPTSITTAGPGYMKATLE